MLGAPRRTGRWTTMKAKTLGWLVSLVLGVIVLGATGSDDANGTAQAAGTQGADPSTATTTAPPSYSAAPHAKAPVAPKTSDEVQASTTVKTTATPGPIEAIGGVCP